MKKALRRLYNCLFVMILALSLPLGGIEKARADVLVFGALEFDLDANAFATGADIPYIEAFAQSINPSFNYNNSQNFLEFAKHSSSAPAGRPAPDPTNFNDLRNSWVRPDSNNLGYDFDNAGNTQPLTFSAANPIGGATGAVRFLGGDSFWFANDSMITPVAGIPASVWIQYGNLSLSYDATRLGGGNSGWVFTNNLFGTLPLYDIRNLTIDAIAAGLTPGSLTMSGDLFTTNEFRDFLGIQAGLDVGNFSFVGATAVPEPSSMLLLTSSTLGGYLAHRLRRRKIRLFSSKLRFNS